MTDAAAKELGLKDLLQMMVAQGGSDLHLATDAHPAVRINGVLQRRRDLPKTTEDWMQAELGTLSQYFDKGAYAHEKSADFGISACGHRFRMNLFRHLAGDAIVARHLGSDFSSIDALNLPPAIERLSGFDSGLVLVCGATGSGKSTTLASLIHMINATSRKHILTIEDPVEYVHNDQASIVRQRELGRDTRDFASAIRAGLREDPDVILVGEMRDLETMRAALTAAETGHLVFSTLHTGNVVGAVNRLVGAFPAQEQDAARLRLSQSLRVVLAQHLLPKAQGQGRVPVVELMFVNHAIRHLIASNKTEQIYSAIESGAEQGMATLEQSLAVLVRSGQIDEDIAKARCSVPEALNRLLHETPASSAQKPRRSRVWP